ncbi:MAG: ABC transporter permease [Bacteroidota bacterium]
MIGNYLKIALRSILKNGVYSFINVFGLAFGLTCSVLIVLWVVDELSFDQFHANKNELYQVYGNSPADNGIASQSAMPLPLAEALKTADPDIQYISVTDWGGEHLLQFEDERLMREGLYVSEEFLKMFSFELVKGDVETALKEPSNIVLTEASALALFGNDEAMGKVLRFDNAADLKVAGIVKNPPSNSTFQFEYLVPFGTYMSLQVWVRNSINNWGNNAFQIYAQLRPGADPLALEKRQQNLIKSHLEQSEMELMLHALPRWRLYSHFENGRSVGGAIEQVRMFSLVAVFILVIACINFMNLATARSEKRAREVGIRKSVGSRRNELIFQFLGESVAVTFIAFTVAICITEMALPFFNDMVGKRLFIDYSHPFFWLASLGIVLLTGLVSGSYPAFYLSSFNAATVLKGKATMKPGSASPRKVLVTLQFIFSIFLITAMIVFNQQVQLGKDRELGYNQENLLLIENTGDIGRNYEVIKHTLIDKGLAVSVTKANSPITRVYAYMGDINWEGKKPEQRAPFATIATEYDYVQTLGMKIKEGRDFSREFNDSTNIIFNQAAIDYMGLKDPIGQTITWNGRTYTIVGVVENVLMSSVYRPVEPTMFVFDPGWFSSMMVRLPAGNASTMLSDMESVFRTYNPAYPFAYLFADLDFQRKFSRIELITQVANLFALLAIVISCLGLFGLAAYTAEQRTKEIGIRKVMGASVTSVVMLLSRDFTLLVLIAFAIAGPGAWWAMDSWLQQYPYRVEVQWWTLSLAGGAALLLALLTVSSQAFRAANSNPAKALRSE